LSGIPHSGQGEDGKKARAWLVGILYVAAVLCSIGLGRPGLWIDEAHSWEFSSLPTAWLVVLNAAARDAYPPLYFLLLHYWMKLGSGEVWLRVLSLGFHLASVPLVYLVARRLIGRGRRSVRYGASGAALIAAALLAFSPFHMAYAREVRMYAPLCFFGLLSVWGLLAWLQDGSRRGLWTMALAALAAVYTQYMGALLVIVMMAALFQGRSEPRARRALARLALVTGIGFLPWAVFFLKAFLVTRGYGAERPILELAFYFLSSVGVGFMHARWVLVVAAGTVLTLAIIGLQAMKKGPGRSLLAWWAFLPLLIELGANALGKPIYGERTLITSIPAWLILMANAVVTMPRHRAALGVACVGALYGVSYAHTLSFGLPGAPRTADAIRMVLAEAKAGDVILHSSTVTYHPVHEYYLPRAGGKVRDYMVEPPVEFRSGRLGSWFREQWRKARERLDPGGVLHTGADPDRVTEEVFLAKAGGRVWYFHTTMEGSRRLWFLQPAGYYAPRPDQVRDVPLSEHAKLARRFRLVSTREFPGLEVELYRR